MPLKMKTFYSEDELIKHIRLHTPTLYHSSKTSTVIPYDKLEKLLGLREEDDYTIADLSKLPAHYSLNEKNNLVVRGPLSWEDAKNYLRSKKRNLKTSPTEQLALVTAGVATSCTGERCFSFGNLRSQVASLKYLDFQGEEKTLRKEDELKIDGIDLSAYQNDFKRFESFKNAPYPRFEKAIDLMIGTEGQLGIITEVELETTEDQDVQYVFITLPRWEENCEPHLEIFEKFQDLRQKVISCEILDSNCMNYLKADEKLGNNQDIIFLEIKAEAFEDVFENVLCTLALTSTDQIFEINESKFHHVRAAVPRAIFEVNSQMGVVKMGTDVQVAPEQFKDLLGFYREASRIGIRYCLFGHFGDAHLHYNYMPSPTDSETCLKQFKKLYEKVLDWKGSPFAEHGIGLLKQQYIKNFHSQTQLTLFKALKDRFDPHRQFFPQGFMNKN